MVPIEEKGLGFRQIKEIDNFLANKMELNQEYKITQNCR